MANPFQGDDEDPFSGVRDKEGNIKQVGLAKSAIPKSDAPKSDAPKSAAPKKNRIVTKEELKKSGFTNLRDFLNDERGLKRRDGKPAERVEAKDKNKAPTREEGRTASGLPREARGIGPGRPKDVSTAGAIQAANQGIPPTPAGSTNIPTTRSPTSPAGASGRDPSRYGKPVRLDELFKKGGSVKSSASKRADGIAVKGKTRGRMV